MVCIYCRAPTQVANSRGRDKNSVIWRRRACTACYVVFTTHEESVLASAFVVVKKNGSFSPLSKETLFVSIYESCKHREQPIEDAVALTDTIIRQLLDIPNNPVGSIPITNVQKTAQTTLQAFDPAAYSYYTAYYAKS